MNRLQKEDNVSGLKVVLTLPALQIAKTPEEYSRILDAMLSLYHQHDAYFIVQSNFDRPQLLKYANGTVDESRILTFADHVEPWFEFIATMDILVSTRIHGGMAGISNQVPAVIIPTDFRIVELVNAMKLPMLPMDKVVGGEKYTSLLQLLNDVPVDFDAFEENRRRKLKEYKRIVEGIGLEMDPELVAIAKQ